MEKKSNDLEEELAIAPNLIPPGAILLTDAHELVVDAIDKNPERELPFDEEWKKILKESKEFEDTEVKHNPVGYQKDGFDKHWFNCIRANLLIRLAIEACELDACIDDPETGKIRKLPTEDWTGEWYWERRVPARIWNNYISSDDYESPGPEGSFRGGALQPVFFLKENFSNWYSRIFEDPQAQSSADTQIAPPTNEPFFPKGYGRTIEAVQQAFARIWPDTKYPPKDYKGVVLFDRVHKELTDMKVPLPHACLSTVERATRKARQQASDSVKLT